LESEATLQTELTEQTVRSSLVLVLEAEDVTGYEEART
jgi:hypothetical protein